MRIVTLITMSCALPILSLALPLVSNITFSKYYITLSVVTVLQRDQWTLHLHKNCLQWAHVIIDGSKSCCQCLWNSPGGVRPRWGGEGRRLSTARSSFPLKLQLCTATTRPSSSLPVWQPCTATRLDPVVHHGRSGNPAPCNQTLHQGLESPAGPSWGSAIAGFADWPVRTLLQEGMPGHSTLF